MKIRLSVLIISLMLTFVLIRIDKTAIAVFGMFVLDNLKYDKVEMDFLNHLSSVTMA